MANYDAFGRLIQNVNRSKTGSFNITGNGTHYDWDIYMNLIPADNFSDFSNDPEKSRIDTSIKWLSVCILAEVMLGLGCTVDLKILRDHIKRPIGVGLAALTQFVLMPLIAFGLAKLFKLPTVAAIVLLITASVPGGSLSNILAYLIKGDLALSMLMTTCSSLLAFAFIPFNLFVYGSHWLPENINYGNLIPIPSVILSLILMMVPVCVGIIINWKLPHVAEKIVTVCKVLLILTIISLAILAAVLYGDSLLRLMPRELWLICVFMPMIGFSLGYTLSAFARLSDVERRTVAIETSCQNGQLGCAILKVAFPNHLIGSFFVFPLLYSVFQLTEGMLLVAFLRYKGVEKSEKLMNDVKAFKRASMTHIRRVSLHVIDNVKQKVAWNKKAVDEKPVINEKEEISSENQDSGVIADSVINVIEDSKEEDIPTVVVSDGEDNPTFEKTEV